MKRLVISSIFCACCFMAVTGVAFATFFDGMEAYRHNDFQTAMREFKSATDDAKALYMIGVMYEKGEGVAIDYAEAVQWYRKSADMDNSSAQYRLGRLYERGQGVEQNKEEAIKWYKKASKQGHVDARQALKRIQAD